MTPQLLVSVRSAAEAEEALAGGADLIDVKEPSLGSLGRADDRVVAEVVKFVAGRVPTSAALGELAEWDGTMPSGVDFVKAGLAGLGGGDWRARLDGFRVAATGRAVIVAYADWQAAAAPSLDDIVSYAEDTVGPVLLIDTFTKTARSLFDYVDHRDLADFSGRIHRIGGRIALAGSLVRSTAASTVSLRSDWIAVRGAVCEGSRMGVVRRELVRRFRRQIVEARSLLTRCFDLGGSGLRTCVLGTVTERIRCDDLGKSPINDIASWVREKVPTLDNEANHGYRFSFSLAGMDKLTARGIAPIPNHRDPVSVAMLFRLPTELVVTQFDNHAHLRACRHSLDISSVPQLSFSVGTGVGFGVLTQKGLFSDDDLRHALGVDPWNLRTESFASEKRAWFALSNDGFDELTRTDRDALGRFERRWLKFLKHPYLDRLASAGCLSPRTENVEVTFSGGVVDYNELWRNNCVDDTIRIRRGPENAGLLGAMLLSVDARLI
jgi:uncharacterized protein (UPF0264 family)